MPRQRLGAPGPTPKRGLRCERSVQRWCDMGRRHRPHSRRQREPWRLHADGTIHDPKSRHVRDNKHLYPEAVDTIAYWTKALPDPEFVYFVDLDIEGSAVKIGWAKDPSARCAELQCGNPEPLVVRRVVLGTRDLEQSLHSRFRDLRIQGEWFEPGDILEYAAELDRIQRSDHEHGRSLHSIMSTLLEAA